MAFDPSIVPNSQKIKLTLDSSGITTDQTDFPLKVVLDGTDPLHSDLFTNLGTNSKRLSIESGSTQLPIEIEFYDSVAEKAVYHTKVPTYTGSVNSELILSYDNSQVDNVNVGDIGDTIAQSVWDSHFINVYHMAQDPSGIAPQILNSVANTNNGTTSGSMTSADLIEMLNGKALDFDSVDDYVDFGASATLDAVTAITIEVLIDPNTWTDYQGILNNSSGSNLYAGFTLDRGASDGDYRINVGHDGSGTYTRTFKNDPTLVPHVITATVDSSSMSIWIDGVQGSVVSMDASYSLDSNSGGLNAAWIPYLSGYYLDGSLGEIRTSDIVRSSDWLKLTNASLRNTVITWSPYITSTSFLAVLSQPYDLIRAILTVVLRQPYDIRQFFLSVLRQPYGADFIAVLIQPYSDKDEFMAVLRQYYGNKPELLKVLRQEYGDRLDLIAVLRQSYDLRHLLLSILKQPYSMMTDIQPAVLKQVYDIMQNNEFLSVLSQKYSMFPDATTDDVVASVTIDGLEIQVLEISFDYDIDQYCASFQLVLAEYSDWLTVDYKQEVIIDINGTDHYSVVVDMNDNVSYSSSTYTVECKSKSVLLDFPFATKVDEDYEVTGTASSVVTYLAGLEGMTVSWEMVSDPVLTKATTVAGSSPLSGIRSIVNSLGGRIQSHPDGSIHAIPRYEVNTNKYAEATTVATITTGLDFTLLSTDVDKRYGYNKYSVSDSTVSGGNSLRTDSISPTKYQAKASIVPWTTEEFILETSETTNITITSLGVTEEVFEEDVEIVEGIGRTQYPGYGVVSQDYIDRTDLGVVTVDEDGTVEATIKGQSIVKLEYTNRYLLWEVVDTDREKVQIILVKT